MKTEKKKMHYAWIIMICCILMKLGNGGAVASIAGNFVTPVVQSFGCDVSQFTLIVSIEAVAMALFYTTASKVLTNGKIGKVMAFALFAEVVGIALMSVYSNVQMMYISAAIIGVAQAFTGYVAVPILINMWFHKKAGTVLGIVMAVSSAATVAYGLLSAQLITALSWRVAYLILAAMALVITVPAVFFFVKSPEDVGCKPYGYEEDSAEKKAEVSTLEDGITKKQAVRTSFFYLAWITCLCYSIGSGVSGYLQNFATMELGQTINFGARAGVCMSIGGILCSLILGVINDKFGVKAGLAWGALTTTIGYVLLLMSFGNAILVYPAALVIGLGSAMYTVQCPLLARSVVGNREYSGIWAIMMMGNSLIGGGLYSSIGLFYDRGGTYRGAFIMAIVLYVAALFIGIISIDLSKRKKAA